jgi:formylglycine-generating enzyme required for sulfatase activity
MGRSGLLRALAAALLCAGCADATDPSAETARVEPTSNPAASAEASPAPEVRSLTEKAPGACPPEMALVEGRYCLTPEERCVEHQNVVGEGGKIVPNQCTRYAEPTVCFAERRKPMRFCMDRFEWPNKKGEPPRTLISWQHAKAFCEAVDKRLCTEEEFNFACEGEAMRPYVYGFSRDPSKCNFDRPYRPRTFAFTEMESCENDGACLAAYGAIDQRLPAGSLESCRSPEGIYDLNGNANEWVIIPGAKSPHRSGIKGGWWGPVRDRCRPTVTFHDEGDFGYEVGFRCCSTPADP